MHLNLDAALSNKEKATSRLYLFLVKECEDIKPTLLCVVKDA